MAITYEPLASTTLTSSASSITFGGIPNTYTDLRVVLTGRTNAGVGSATTIRFNSDAATNYSWTYVSGNTSAASSTRATSQTSVIGPYLTNDANIATGNIDIFSYASSTLKSVLVSMSNASFVRNAVGLWLSTAAITSITLSNTNAMEIGTTANLYGILKA